MYMYLQTDETLESTEKSMNEDRLLIKLWQSQKQRCNTMLKLLRKVYDAGMRKQENECTKKN